MRGENVVSADNHLMHVRRKEGEQMCELTHEFAQSVGHANILVMQIFPPNDRVEVGGGRGHGHGQSVVEGRKRTWTQMVQVSMRSQLEDVNVKLKRPKYHL